MNTTRPIYGEMYFGIAGLLLLRFLWKTHRLKRSVQALPVWQDDLTQQLIGEMGTGLSRRYLQRVRIYVTKERISPFSGGLLHPYVVLPKQLVTEWQREELRTVLCHELVHVLSGHIFWMYCFAFLKIYWWINPVVYLCDRLLREDLELACDRQCVQYADVSGQSYGNVLLRMVTMMQGKKPEAGLCFSEQRDFDALRKRLENLAKRKPGDAIKRHRQSYLLCMVCFAALLVVNGGTSYPRYTVCRDLVLFDESVQLLDYHSEELQNAVQVCDGRLVIDEERFGEILSRKGVSDEYVYLSYEVIMKVPGVGGGGSAGMISVADCSDIFYMQAETLENEILLFWLKYLI